MATPLRIPRKVLMTADTVGGVWTFALELAELLVRRGVGEIHLATMGAPLSAAQWAQVRGNEAVTVHESSYRLEWMDEPWSDVERAGAWLLELDAELQPDLVHLNNYCHGHLPFSAPVLMVGHSCVLSWWQAVLGERAPERYARYAHEVSRGLRAARRVIAPTRAMLEALEANYGPLPHGRVILNGRDPARFRVAPKEPLVLSAGRLWDQAKNVEALARVAHELPWPVAFAGDAKRPSGELMRFAGVETLGVLPPDELAGWMARASIYALPARYEPFGLSVLEAALSGCALVLGDIPSLRELWGQAARFVPPDDHRSLVRAIRSLIDEPDVRDRLAHAARVRAQTLRASTMADAYLAAYSELRSPSFDTGLRLDA